MTARGMAPRQTALVLYLALTASPLLFTLVALYLRSRPSAPVAAGPGSEILPWVAVGGALAGYGAALVLRGRIQPPDGGTPEDAWWTANQTRMLLVWALVEGPMLLGGVVYLLQGDLATLVTVVGAGLLLMILHAPARLRGA